MTSSVSQTVVDLLWVHNQEDQKQKFHLSIDRQQLTDLAEYQQPASLECSPDSIKQNSTMQLITLKTLFHHIQNFKMTEFM